MWQRIQTLYLAISTALTVILLFSLKAVVPDGNGGNSEEIKYIEYVPYLILILIAALLNMLALTSYKFRVFQMRTTVLSAIITLALQAWLAVDYFATSGTVVFRYTAIFPLVCVILNIMAARNIFADQMMVESFSRLRSRKKK